MPLISQSEIYKANMTEKMVKQTNNSRRLQYLTSENGENN